MQIAGLPLHPLLVHAAVVIVPLAAIAFVAAMWREDWRRRYLWLVALAAVGGGVAAFLAAQSGEALEHGIRDAAAAAGSARPDFGDHPEQGDAAEALSMLFALAAAALWLVQRRAAALPVWAPRAAYGVGVLAALAALGMMVVAGDTGARLVWQELGSFPTGR